MEDDPRNIERHYIVFIIIVVVLPDWTFIVEICNFLLALLDNNPFALLPHSFNWYVLQEDLWQEVFPVGTEVRICSLSVYLIFDIVAFCLFIGIALWFMLVISLHIVSEIWMYSFSWWQWDQIDMVYQYKWNFSNLEVSWLFAFCFSK